MALAYCQAELYAEYMLEAYGEDALAKMLSAYADNLSTRQALERSFHVSQQDFETGYKQHLEKIVAGLSTVQENQDLLAPRIAEAARRRSQEPGPAGPAGPRTAQSPRLSRGPALVDKALAAEPKQQLAAYVRARLHMVVGEDDQAYKLLAAALDPADPQDNLLGLLAGLELARDNHAEAARLYELGAKADPGDVKWVKSLARVYLKSGERQKLAEVLSRLAAVDPDDATVRKKLADLAQAAKDHAATVRWCQEVLQIDVMDPQTHRWLADALMALGKPDEAAEEYEVATELMPDEPGLWFQLAQARLDARQPAQAKAALEALLKLDPKYPGADLLLEGLKP